MMELNGVSKIAKSLALTKSNYYDYTESKANYQLYTRKIPVLSTECITKFGGKQALLEKLTASEAMDGQTGFIQKLDAMHAQTKAFANKTLSIFYVGVIVPPVFPVVVLIGTACFCSTYLKWYEGLIGLTMLIVLIINIIELSIFFSERNHMNTVAYEAGEGQMACVNNF